MGCARLLTAAAAVAVALGGCTVPGGGGGGVAPTLQPDGPPPEQQVVELVTRLGTSSDPEQCTEAFTPRALRAMVGSSDLQACRDAVAASTPADDVEVDQVVVGDATATARVTSVGGDSGGLSQTIALVRSADGWRVDGVTDVRIVDRAAVDARAAAVVQEMGTNLMPPEKLACVDSRMRTATDAELEEVYRRARGHAVLAEAVRDCVGAGVDMVALLFLSEHQLIEAGLPQETATCLAGLAMRDYAGLTVEQLVTDPEARQRWNQSLLVAAEEEICTP